MFWEVFYKDDTCKCEIIGLSTDDTDFNNKVFEIQQAGCRIHCQTIPDDGRSRENVINDIMIQLGYEHVDGLFYDTYLKRNKLGSGKEMK